MRCHGRHISAALMAAAGLIAGACSYASTGALGFGTEPIYAGDGKLTSDVIITGGGGTCTVYGPGYEFSLATPPGWTPRVSDRDQEGRYVTYYPVGKPWILSDDVMYAFGVTKDDWVRGVDDAIEYDLAYYEDGCPGYSSKEEPPLETGDGNRSATVMDYTCGTVDSVAYIDEEYAVIVIAFSAGDEVSHKANHEAFERLAGSYRYKGDGL